MPEHKRECCSLLISKREELRRVITNYIAIERYIICDPQTIEDGAQHQLIFGRLSYRFSLVDQQARLLQSHLGFDGGVPFDMDQRSYERDLKIDLVPAQRCRSRQARDLLERASELSRSFDQRRARQGLLSRLAP